MYSIKFKHVICCVYFCVGVIPIEVVGGEVFAGDHRFAPLQFDRVLADFAGVQVGRLRWNCWAKLISAISLACPARVNQWWRTRVCYHWHSLFAFHVLISTLCAIRNAEERV